MTFTPKQEMRIQLSSEEKNCLEKARDIIQEIEDETEYAEIVGVSLNDIKVALDKMVIWTAMAYNEEENELECFKK